jgi:uncharacterized repeat protein (TIGR01451 family)
MRSWKRTQRSLGVPALVLAVVLAPLATASSAAADVVTSTSQLAPSLLSVGRTAFYSASWTNAGTATMTNPVAVITLPAGSVLVSPAPPVCSADVSGSVVSCPQRNLAGGASVTQQLLVRMFGSGQVTAVLRADESTNDQNTSHQDTFPAPDQSVAVVGPAADAAGGCLKNGDQPLATRDGLSTANPLITTAVLTGPSGVPVCVPVTVKERAATSSTDACGQGATCTTDVAVTDYVPVSTQSPSSPVQLTFTVLANTKNLTWYKNGSPVPDCLGATNLPGPTVNACVNSRAKTSSTSVRLGVLWRAGIDPSWRG